ncbi:DUF4230 domain-containing protein [Patescibacteria group bacterium]|nr:DUF4230 domain-containing protein [Patescibacteria group bacterium]MBP9710211.1 DUF4230 domain-containing protein [Patescibacteria group bacterium]
MSSLKAVMIAFFAIICFSFGFGLGYLVFHPEQVMQRAVTSQAILTTLRDRGFLVTQTYIFNEPIVIEKQSGQLIRDFFLGQKITARGAMEVNLGIDLSRVMPEDIQISEDAIRIAIPSASLFNVRLVGPLDIQNEQGLLKRILQNDAGYNEAQSELIRVAEEQARKPELIQRANTAGKAEVERWVGYMGENRRVEVVEKK